MLTETQQEALRLLNTGVNVFLTGKAGTGKSFVLKEFTKNSDKNILITAPTGVAAIEIGGATLHRTFNIPMNMSKLKRNIKIKKAKTNPVVAADIVIIDEISMVRRDVFEYVMRYIEKVNRYHRKGKDKIQVILVGDFFQLPPVLAPKDVEIYKLLMGDLNIYPFESEYWNKFDFNKIELKEVMRQKDDDDFLENLNKIRNGDVSAIDYFNKRVDPDFEVTHGINILPTNAKVKELNDKSLLKLNTKAKKYKAKKSGTVNKSDMLNDEELLLKEGAKVMITVNHPLLEYSNGSLGIISELKEDSVDVTLLDTGQVVNIEYKENIISEYIVMDDIVNLQQIGTYSQLPLKIAYAITIHKSQGKTFDEVHLDPTVWSDGQLYVALSRVTSINGLTLTKPISPSAVKVSKDVLRFYEYEVGDDVNVEEVEQQTKEEKEQQKIELQKQLQTNFDFLKVIMTDYIEEMPEGKDLKEMFPNVLNIEEVINKLKNINLVFRT